MNGPEILAPRGAPVGGILVIHSWWGLTPSFRAYGAALARAGFAVGLADLFDGATAATEAGARALRARPRRRPMYRSLADDLATLHREAGGKIGVAGFSMGGHWAVWLAQRPEYRVSAAVLYYVARAGSFAACRAAVQAHFAGPGDPFLRPAARRRMEAELRKAGRDYRAFDYPGCGHWFAECERGEYDAAAARAARDRDIAFFRQSLACGG